MLKERGNEEGSPNAREEAFLSAGLRLEKERQREKRPSLREGSISSHSLLWVRAGGAGPEAVCAAAADEAAEPAPRCTRVARPRRGY